MDNPGKPISGTYARTMLSDWPLLVKIITGSDAPNLSQADIDRALSGPLGDFFRQKIAAYMQIMKEAHGLALTSEEAFKSLVDPKQAVKSAGEITKSLSDLSEKTEKDYQEWLHEWEQFSASIVQSLLQKKVILNSIEVEDLSRQEPLEELHKRYQDLQLALPKLKSNQMNLENYLYLKTYLAIQSNLSRQHFPHEAADILGVLKLLKKDFQLIAQTEKALLKKQKLDGSLSS